MADKIITTSSTCLERGGVFIKKDPDISESLVPLRNFPDYKMVGATRFELATTRPPVWCATRLRYAPITNDITSTAAAF